LIKKKKNFEVPLIYNDAYFVVKPKLHQSYSLPRKITGIAGVFSKRDSSDFVFTGDRRFVWHQIAMTEITSSDFRHFEICPNVFDQVLLERRFVFFFFQMRVAELDVISDAKLARGCV
jgi:hypothetical protein